MSDRENEKELILGNSQLISLFFVVVALCGVFFALGYMIGRNSTHSTLAGSEAPAAAANAPAPAERPRESDTTALPPATQTPPAQEPPPAAAEPATSTVQTQSARELPAAPAPTAARGKESPLPAAPAAKPASATAETQPLEAGASYLQVAALRHDDAAKLVRTLREQELPARLAESPKPEVFRVLVGPYHQPAQIAEAKAKLKTLGFANAFVQK